MKIRKFFSVNNDVYKVSLTTEDWSENDLNLMARFGEPEVDVGGSFTTPTFTLPSNLVKVKSEVPITQTFDVRDYANAEARADKWEETISARINAAVVALRTETDDFTREEVENV